MRVGRVVAWTLAAALGLAVGARAAEQTIDVKRPASRDVRVEIDNLAGSVKVIGWDKAEVAVSGRIDGAAEDVQVTGTAERIRIEVEHDSHVWGHDHPRPAHLEVRMPVGGELEVESVEADLSVADLTGQLRLHTVQGSITVTGTPSEVEANSVGGRVDIASVKKRVEAVSVNGVVTLRGGQGEAEANAVNGDLEIVGGSFSRGRFETVSGGIRFKGDIPAKAELEFETVSGDVELGLPAAVSAEFTVNSFSGDIVNELGPEARKTSRWVPEKELEFTAGAGGARIDIHTLSGNISLRKR